MSSTYTSRKELRTEKFTITNTIWTRHRLNTKKRVGCMNQIFKQYYNENKDIFEQLTADDFVEYYFSKCITKKQFFQTVNKFYSCCKDAGIKITKTEAFNFCIIRVCDDTWDGFHRELRAIKNIEEWYPDADVHFSTVNDMKYCIDIEVWYGDIFLDAYQVKPRSFVQGVIYNKSYCIQEYNYISNRLNEFYNDYKIKPMYYIEDKDCSYEVKDFKSLIA